MGNQVALGQARGEILIDVASVQAAVKAAQQAAQQINAAFASLGQTGGGAGTSATQQFQQAVQGATQAAQQGAQAGVAAIAQTGQAALTTMRQNAQATAQAVQQAAQQAQQAANQAGGGGGRPGAFRPGSGFTGMPTFIQFAAYPFAQAATSLGAPGVGGGIMAAGAMAGIADTIAVVSQTVGELSRRLLAMGGVIGQLAQMGATAAAGLGATGAALGSIVAVAIPFVAAFAAIAAVIQLAQRAAEESAKRVQEFVDAVVRVSNAVADGTTTAEAAAEAERHRVQAAYLNAQLQDLRAQADAARTGAPAQVHRELLGQIDKLEDEMTTATTAATELETAIAAGVFTMNDMADAAARAQQAMDQLLSSELDARQRVSDPDLTTDQAMQMAEEAKRQSGVISGFVREYWNILSQEQRDSMLQSANELLNASGIYAEAAKDPARRIREASQDIIEFNQAYFAALEDYNRETARIQQDRLREAIQEEEDFNRRYAQMKDDFNRQLLRAEEDYERNRQQMIEAFNRNEARLFAEYQESRQELIDDFNEQQQELEVEHQENMARILKDGREDILEAASRLDARGVFEAQRRMREQLEDEQDAFEDSQQQLQENLAEQLADLDEAYEEQKARRAEEFARQLAEQQAQYELQRQRRIEDFQLQVQRMNEERNIRLQRQSEEFAIADARRQQEFARQVQDLIDHNTTMQAVQTYFQNLGITNFTNWWNSINGVMTGGATTTTGQPPNPTVGQTYTDASGQMWVWNGSTWQEAFGSNPLQGALGGSGGGRMFLPTPPMSAPSLGTGGGMSLVFSGDWHFGDIGSYAPREIQSIVAQGIEAFFTQGTARISVRGG